MKYISLICLFLLVVSCRQENRNSPEMADEAILTEVSDIVPTEEDSGVVERLTLFEKLGRELYIERDSARSYCYQVKNGVRETVRFGNDYLDDGAFMLTAHKYGKFVYIVGDVMPNGNGWTTRFYMYQINTDDFAVKFICSGAAVRFKPDEIVVAEARLTNEDAERSADEIWLMHDVHYDTNGRLTRKDKREYDFQEMERRFGENP